MTSSRPDQHSAGQTQRYVAPTRDEMTKQQAELYDRIVLGPRARARRTPLIDEDGRLIGPFSLMAISPAIGDAVQLFGAQIRYEGTLNDCERELAILTVAAHHQSGFEWFVHTDEAIQAGLTWHHLSEIKAGRQPRFIDLRLTIISSTSNTLLRDGTLADAEYRKAYESLGETGLIELIWLCGYYSMLAMALSAMRPAIPTEACNLFMEE